MNIKEKLTQFFEKRKEKQKVKNLSKKPADKKKVLKAAKDLLLKTLFLCVAGYLIWTYVGEVHIVHYQDMYPAIKDGDLVISYKMVEAYNGDVIVYFFDNTYYYGRVVGIPGDEIDITENGYFTVNGSIPYETIYYVTKPVEGGPVNYPYKVQEGELFVLADMRDNGKDSRYFGAIPVDCYRGKAVLIVRRRGI